MVKSRSEIGTPRRSAKSFQLGQRVNVLSTNKRKPSEIKGRGATVVGLPGNGWIIVALANDEGPPVRVQQRYLTHDQPDSPTAGDAAKGARKSTNVSPSSDPEGPRPLKLRIIGEIGEAIAGAHNGGKANTSTVPSTPASPASRRAASPKQAAAAASTKAAGNEAGAQATASTQQQKEVLKKVRSDVLDAESHIPWSAVRSFWRSRRSKWRSATKAAEGVRDMATRLAELRSALVAETAAFPVCGPEWQAGMDACSAGTGTHAELLAVWEELRGGIGAWLAGRAKPNSHLLASQHAVAARVVLAMARWQAAAGDNEEAREDFIEQVPVEAICDHKPENLAAVRTMIERERKFSARSETRLKAGASTPAGTPGLTPAGIGRGGTSPSSTSAPSPLSPQGILDGQLAAALGDNFDSGAESEAGSAVTVFSEAYSSGCDSD